MLGVWFVLAIGGLGADDTEAYRAALREYEMGRLEAAAAGFDRLTAQGPNIGPLAAYALANTRVRQAAGESPAARNALLREAIAAYRRVLNTMPTDATLPTADVRHNLELAKRLIDWSL